MISEDSLKKIVKGVLSELNLSEKLEDSKEVKSEVNKVLADNIEQKLIQDDNEEELIDITEIDLKKELSVEDPKNPEAFLKLKEKTPARIGVGRCGPRYKTKTLLRFRADHAVAMDGVFSNVAEDLLEEMGLFMVKTKCKDKDEYLTRPDLGRKFDEEAINTIKEKCKSKPQVQIYVSDGLSSTAIEANLKDILPAIMQGLDGYGIEVGIPFFVKYGRVPAMDVISDSLEADVTCVLIGERPGLATAESMSAYIAYQATVGMPEARRTVVSNIHQGGTPTVEAGAHIAEVIKKMLEQKASGLDLDL